MSKNQEKWLGAADTIREYMGQIEDMSSILAKRTGINLDQSEDLMRVTNESALVLSSYRLTTPQAVIAALAITHSALEQMESESLQFAWRDTDVMDSSDD